MGYKNSDKCLGKAYEDERLFILMARDSTSPQVVGEWIKMNIGKQPREKLIEALDGAIEMHETYTDIKERKSREELDKILMGVTRTEHEKEIVRENMDKVNELRPELLYFASLMENILDNNSHKGEAYKTTSYPELFERLEEEKEELANALNNISLGGGDAYVLEAIKEAVDVANFAMFIADNLRYKRNIDTISKT